MSYPKIKANVHLQIPYDLRKFFKVQCAHTGETFTDVVIKCLEKEKNRIEKNSLKIVDEQNKPCTIVHT